jgi:hypothetical protein
MIKINIYIFIIMDNSNSNSLTSSIIQSNSPVQYSNIQSTGDGSGFFDTLKSINLTTWLLVILILAFLGFNVFVYLAKGTQDITNFFAPLFELIFGKSVEVTGQTIDVSAEGAKTVVSGSATAVNTGLTAVQDITPNRVPSSIKNTQIQTTIPQQNVDANNTLNKALTAPRQSAQQNEDYEAQEATSSLKAGWCYIGEDRGYRTCAQVGVNDQCMSGDIFPSQELCINPNLRM